MKKFHFIVLATAVAVAASLTGCSAEKPTRADLDEYVKARDLYLRGSIDESASLVSRIPSRTRGFHQARLLEGKILFFKGAMADAERIFRGLVGRFPGYIEAQIWLLRSLQAQGKTAEAERLLDRALELNPGDPRLLHLAGMLRLGADDIDGALRFFRRSEDFAGELAQSYIEAARIQFRFGLVDSALADLAIAPALLPAESDLRGPVQDLVTRIREAGK